MLTKKHLVLWENFRSHSFSLHIYINLNFCNYIFLDVTTLLLNKYCWILFELNKYSGQIYLYICGMTRCQQIALGCIGFCLLYIIVIHVPLTLAVPLSDADITEFHKICSFSTERTSSLGVSQDEGNSSLPILYVVTPTYHRPEMAAELTRIGQTLLLVPTVHWLLAEDKNTCSGVISQFLKMLGIPYTHFASPMPDVYRKMSQIPRGVSNRRAALQWVKEQGDDNAVLYFLDDDNTIDIRLFDEMRDTRKVSMWPVGLIDGYSVSSPIVDETGTVIGFYDAWGSDRQFKVDMAGFAVNVGYLKKQKSVSMPYISGQEEDGFLKSLNITLSDIEVKANNCTEILVWHTRTNKNPVRYLNLNKHLYDNIKELAKFMRKWRVIH